MISVLAFISGVIRGGSSLTGPTESWAATKTGNTNGIAASNRFIGYSALGSTPRIWDRRRERPDLYGGPHEGLESVRLAPGGVLPANSVCDSHKCGYRSSGSQPASLLASVRSAEGSSASRTDECNAILAAEKASPPTRDRRPHPL